MRNPELRIPLLILRLGLGAFLLLFGVDKLVAPHTAAAVFVHYYGLDVVPGALVYAAGLAEIALALAVLAGLWKTLTYGLGFLVHAVSTFATYRELLAPFGGNHLYLAALPVLAAFVALFLLRDHDVLWSVDARRTADRSS
jgi:uncharacterized membrane protein YphA (DoxX/SURF4 family)